MLRVVEDKDWLNIFDSLQNLFHLVDKIDSRSETFEEIADEEDLYIISNAIQKLAKEYHKENHNDSYYPANWKLCHNICGDLWNIIIELGRI